MSFSERPLLIVIVGPTGSGKTALSIRLAQHYDAPIISTDARQIFRGMAIGTAQPTAEELAAATHYFIASHDIHEQYTCGRYEQEALAKLEELFAAGHRTVVAVGGAGLYVKALCEGIDEIPQASEELREQLSQRLRERGVEDLFSELERLDPTYAAEVDRHNPARVQRALEVCLASGRTFSEFRTGEKRTRNFDIIKIGTEMDRAELYDRIDRRVDMMMTEGLEAEARALYPFRHLNSLQTVGYKEMFDYFDGLCSRDEAVELIKRNSRRYAKRQLTWFRRDEQVIWHDPRDVEGVITCIEQAKRDLPQRD